MSQEITRMLDVCLDLCITGMDHPKYVRLERYEYSGRGLPDSYGLSSGQVIFVAQTSSASREGYQSSGYGITAESALQDLLAKVIRSTTERLRADIQEAHKRAQIAGEQLERLASYIKEGGDR